MGNSARIAVVGIVGIPARYGGFETLVENIVDCDRSFTVYCSSRVYKERVDKGSRVRLVYLPLDANGVQSIAYDCLSLFHAVTTGHSKILILGVSGAIALPIVRLLFPKVRLVVNIDGLEWRRPKWKFIARHFLRFSEGIAVRYSHAVITDNEAIRSYVSERYGKNSELIAYGGDHALTSRLSGGDNGYALALCRIEPENNVHLILEAFADSTYKIKFIGNWENSEYGRRMKAQYGGSKSIEIIDPIYDIDRLFEYRDKCTYYVHGHSAGGTNPSLVEMMHFGKPIIAFDCQYNRATLEGKGYYFDSAETLRELLAAVSKLGGDEHMRSIAGRRYTWKQVREQYLKLLI